MQEDGCGEYEMIKGRDLVALTHTLQAVKPL